MPSGLRRGPATLPAGRAGQRRGVTAEPAGDVEVTSDQHPRSRPAATAPSPAANAEADRDWRHSRKSRHASVRRSSSDGSIACARGERQPSPRIAGSDAASTQEQARVRLPTGEQARRAPGRRSSRSRPDLSAASLPIVLAIAATAADRRARSPVTASDRSEPSATDAEHDWARSTATTASFADHVVRAGRARRGRVLRAAGRSGAERLQGRQPYAPSVELGEGGLRASTRRAASPRRASRSGGHRGGVEPDGSPEIAVLDRGVTDPSTRSAGWSAAARRKPSGRASDPQRRATPPALRRADIDGEPEAASGRPRPRSLASGR